VKRADIGATDAALSGMGHLEDILENERSAVRLGYAAVVALIAVTAIVIAAWVLYL
jgi:hypothetical protein